MRSTNLYVIGIASIAAIGGFLLGFDGSVISGAIPFYKEVFGLQDGSFLLGFSVSCIIWGSVIGNMLAGPLSDRIGRKPSLVIAALLFTATGLICAFAQNIGLFIAGRFIGGLGVGIAILVAPVYIAEIAPARNRGWLVSFNQLLIVVGLSAAYFSNYFILKTVEDPLVNWRWMLGIESIPALLYLVLIVFIPESPRWLLMRRQDSRAMAILRKVNGEEGAETAFHEIKNSLAGETKTAIRQQAAELFSKRMKRVLVIGFGLGILQQFSGINAILYYAPVVFESTGGGRDAAFLQAIVLGLVFVIMTIVSMFLIDRLGRKPLLYTGVSIMALSLTLVGWLFYQASYTVSREDIKTVAAAVAEQELGARGRNNKEADNIPLRRNLFEKSLAGIEDKSYASDAGFYKAVEDALGNTGLDAARYKPGLLKQGIRINSRWVLFGILGFIAGFSISLGPVMWAMFSEIFPNQLRGFAISVVGAANALASFVVATFFPVQLALFGNANTYFLYAALMYFCLWFTWKYVVETKGKTLEQLEKELTRND